MNKILKITKACTVCKSPLVVTFSKADVGKTKRFRCQKCGKNLDAFIPQSYAEKFDANATVIDERRDIQSLLIETVPTPKTEYQCFELTSDFYTIGRKNETGPEHRPDIEVITTDRNMSRIHAAISKIVKDKAVNGFTIKDMKSKNGVVIDSGKMLPDEELYLNDGDIFRLGDTEFRVVIAECSGSNNNDIAVAQSK